MAAERSAVLLDWGGVMTSDLFGSFAAFCAEEGLDPDVLANLFRHDRDARALLIDFECGRIEEADFEPRLSTALGLAWHDGLIDRLFGGAALDQDMVDGVRALHERGVPTGLVSNSWGTRRYPRDLLAELFDGLVISGEEGFRKPDPRMYELGAQRIGVAPASASSSTTSRSTWTPRASWGWRWCITRRRPRRWRSWSGWWVSAAPRTASPREAAGRGAGSGPPRR